jgi:hypothetical protein
LERATHCPLFEYLICPRRQPLSAALERTPIRVLEKALGDAVSLQAQERRVTFGAEFVDKHPACHALHQALALRNRHRLDLEKRLFDVTLRMIALPIGRDGPNDDAALAKLVSQKLIVV